MQVSPKLLLENCSNIFREHTLWYLQITNKGEWRIEPQCLIKVAMGLEFGNENLNLFLYFINRSISIVRNICYSSIDFSQLLLIYVPRFWVGYITSKQIPVKVSAVSAMYSFWDCMIVRDLEIFANKWQHIHIRSSEPIFFLFSSSFFFFSSFWGN